MGILHRYVFREVALSSGVAVGLFTLVLFLNRVEPVMELLVGRQVPPGDMLKLLLLAVPQAFPFTIPMGVLTGTLVAVGRLSSDHEVLAMVASGIRSRALAVPVSMVATVGAVACAVTTLWLSPWSFREQDRTAAELRIQLAGTEVVPRVFLEDYPDRVIWVQDVMPGEGIHWKGIFLADMRPPAVRGSIAGFNTAVDGPRITLGTEAFVLPRPQQGRVQVRFPLTTTYEMSKDPENYLAFRSQAADQVLEAPPNRFDPMVQRYESMRTADLAATAGEAGDPAATVLLHDRFSLPFACWLLPLLGLPLAISVQGAGRATGVLAAMGLCFGYWMVSLGATALAERGALPAEVAAWSATIVFAAAGLVLLWNSDGRPRAGAAHTTLARVVAGIRRLPVGAVRGLNGAAYKTRSPIRAPLPVVDRYVLRSFLYYLAVFLVVFIAIWYIFSFFELLGDMLERDKVDRFVPYIYYLTPFLVYNTAPLAVMVAALICFGIMAIRHELTAFRSCGVSLYRLAVPVLAVAGILSGALFMLEETYLPAANQRQDALRDEIKGRPPRTYLRPDRQWTFGLTDRIFYHRAFDPGTNTFSGIGVFDLRREPFELKRHIQAERARWDAAEEEWVFENGWSRNLAGIQTEHFETFDARSFRDIVEPPSYFLKRDRRHQQMNLAQLQAYISDLTQSGFDTVRLRVSMHKKLAFPLFCFAMALTTVPFALRYGGGRSLRSVCVALGLILAFYASSALAEQLGHSGQLQPSIAAWAPCLLFTIGGSYLMLRVRT